MEDTMFLTTTIWLFSLDHPAGAMASLLCILVRYAIKALT